MPDIMGAYKPARSIRVFITFAWHTRHRIIRSMAGGLIMCLFLEAFLPALDGLPFQVDWADLVLWLGFGLVIGILNAFESKARMPEASSDFHPHA